MAEEEDVSCWVELPGVANVERHVADSKAEKTRSKTHVYLGTQDGHGDPNLEKRQYGGGT